MKTCNSLFTELAETFSNEHNKPASMSIEMWRDFAKQLTNLQSRRLMHPAVHFSQSDGITTIFISCRIKDTDNRPCKLAYCNILAMILEGFLRGRGYDVIPQIYNKIRQPVVEIHVADVHMPLMPHIMAINNSIQ